MRSPRYLLLNPRACDPMGLECAEQLDADDGLYAVAQPHIELPAHWALRLIDLHRRPDLREQLTQWLSNDTLPRGLLGGWLVTDAAPDLLRQHLEHQMVHLDPDGQRRLLRHFDPTIFDQIIHVLDAAQLRALMGTIEAWGYLDADRRVQTIERPDPVPGATSLRREQWAALAKAHEVNSIRRAWQALRQGEPLPDNHYRHITTWQAMADEHALEETTDRVSFVLLGIARGWRFDHTPFFRDLLNRHRTTDITLTDFLERVTAEQWARLEQWPHKDVVTYE